MIKYFWVQIKFWLNIWKNRYQSKPHRLKYLLKIIRKKDLKPGDLIILKHHNRITEENLIHLRKSVQKHFPKNVKILLLEESLDITQTANIFCPNCKYKMTVTELFESIKENRE